jgi:predicted metal-dependent TIM-barrel fold hydrolase
MVRSVTTKAKNAITNVAQRGVENVRSVASDAGAAAKAAADVVLESTSSALQAGRARVRQVTPAMKQAIGMAPRRKKKVAKRKVARKKTASRRKTKRRARR